ncbi:MAG TPA: hypothetical protein ENO03_02175, partial [Candidatus Aminicenantes bacterium]|nr:hypothetical protein [Candidatus Aminicenantes bacterium]
VRRGFLAAGTAAAGGAEAGAEPGAEPGADDPVFGAIAPAILAKALAGGRPRLISRGSDRLIYIEPVLPLPRLIIAGAGHVGRAVARLGKLLDFVITVIDDRPEFANAANVPEADEIVVAEFGPALAGIEDTPDNYFIIVTRGHRKDAEALRAVIGREAAYIGMIGSPIKVGLMRQAFLENGWATEEQWAGIHSPIGLAIGSKTVEEIAVSIAAELVKVRSGLKDGREEDEEGTGTGPGTGPGTGTGAP